MAAYAASVTINNTMKAVGALGVVSGVIDVTNYNTTLAEITGVTGQFRGDPWNVMVDPISENGYIVRWDYTSLAIKAYYPTISLTHDHDFLVIGGGTVVTDGNLGVDASGDLVKVEAANLTIEGADSAADGGVLSEALAAAAGSEVVADVDIGTVRFLAFGKIGR